MIFKCTVRHFEKETAQQRQVYGKTGLLAELAALPQTDLRCAASVCAVGLHPRRHEPPSLQQDNRKAVCREGASTSWYSKQQVVVGVTAAQDYAIGAGGLLRRIAK